MKIYLKHCIHSFHISNHNTITKSKFKKLLHVSVSKYFCSIHVFDTIINLHGIAIFFKLPGYENIISIPEKQKCAHLRACIIKSASNNFIGAIKAVLYEFDTDMVYHNMKILLFYHIKLT